MGEIKREGEMTLKTGKRTTWEKIEVGEVFACEFLGLKDGKLTVDWFIGLKISKNQLRVIDWDFWMMQNLYEWTRFSFIKNENE